MNDFLNDLFRSEAERVEIPRPDLQGTLHRGSKLAMRRRAAVVLAGVAVATTAAFVVPRIDGMSERRSVAPPVEQPDERSDDARVKDNTMLSIDAAGLGPHWEQYYVAVTLVQPGAESGSLSMAAVCFALPKWAAEARIMDANGIEVSAFPGSIGIQETDSALISCAPGPRSALENLALSPGEHRIEISGARDPITAALDLRSARDFEESDYDETETLEYKATRALDRGDLDAAFELGRERLLTAPDRSHWDHGNAIHYGHLILGHVALRRGEVREAKRQLLLAGRSPGSPQLDSFGPNMSLARDLFLTGNIRVVLEYFDLVDEFWELDNDLDTWKQQVRTGVHPTFGFNEETGALDPSPYS
jgi:hypothetical protein